MNTYPPSVKEQISPTWLYVKTHVLTGMLYLGKTTRKDPDSYLGSGRRWRNHINIHGTKHVMTIWKRQFTNGYELYDAAMELSNKATRIDGMIVDVVASPYFANLVLENGFDGALTGENNPMKRPEVRAKFMGENSPMKRLEARAKIGAALKGRVFSEETRAKMSAAKKGDNNAMKRPEVAAKISAAQRGKQLSEDTKAKMSAAKKGKQLSEDTKAKMSAAQHAYRQRKREGIA